MLELRPTCEQCNVVLPPAAEQARICSYECTFCADCVDAILLGVCPNCGGGFVPRPIRPVRDHKDGNYLGNDPASATPRYRPVDPAEHAAFATTLKNVAPAQR